MFLNLLTPEEGKLSTTICDSIAGNIGNWNLALDFTPNKRGKTACSKELAELIAANEKMTIFLFLLEALLMPELPLKEELHWPVN